MSHVFPTGKPLKRKLNFDELESLKKAMIPPVITNKGTSASSRFVSQCTPIPSQVSSWLQTSNFQSFSSPSNSPNSSQSTSQRFVSQNTPIPSQISSWLETSDFQNVGSPTSTTSSGKQITRVSRRSSASYSTTPKNKCTEENVDKDTFYGTLNYRPCTAIFSPPKNTQYAPTYQHYLGIIRGDHSQKFRDLDGLSERFVAVANR